MGNTKSIISTDIEKQCVLYKERINYIVAHKLFVKRDEKLETLIDTYIQFYHDRVEGTDALDHVDNVDHVNNVDPNIISVWGVHQLYPMKYREGYIEKEWLIKKCLHHYVFCREIVPVLQYNFNFIKWEKEYMTLLNNLKKHKKGIVPTLKQVFMLYFYMQYHDHYIKDIVIKLGYVLSPSLNFVDIHNQISMNNRIKKFTLTAM